MQPVTTNIHTQIKAMRVRSSDVDTGTSVEAITHARFVELFRMQNMPMRSIIASRTIWCFVRYNWNEIKLIQWLLFMGVRSWYVIVIEKLATSPGFTRVSIIFLCLLVDKLLVSHTGISILVLIIEILVASQTWSPTLFRSGILENAFISDCYVMIVICSMPN